MGAIRQPARDGFGRQVRAAGGAETAIAPADVSRAVEPTTRRIWLLGPIALLAVLPAVLPAVARAASVSVTAENFRFVPAELTVTVGDTVVWRFSGEPHTVTSGLPGAPDGRFDSGIVAAGGTYGYRFVEPGTYRYFCAVHPEDMTGRIVVEAAQPPPTPAATPAPTPALTPTRTPTPTPRRSASPPTSTRPTARATPTPLPTATPAPTARPTLAIDPSAAVGPTTTARPTAAPGARTPSPTASTAAASAATAPAGPPEPAPVPAATAPPEPAAAESDPAPLALAAALLAVVVAAGIAAGRLRSRPG